MVFNTTAASNTPDLKRLPISALHPGLSSLATQSIVAIVTLVWPYSSSTRACALLLAEPDFRLRRRRGQVRVQFFADAAEAVATSGVGIGDVVVLRLGPGVQWLQSSGEEEVVRTPGKSVEWELRYRRALRLRAWRDGEVLASLDVRGEVTPDRQIEEAEEEGYNTPSKIFGRFSGEGLNMGSWNSPAFLKCSRLSLDSRRDSNDLFADEDGYVEGKGRKKRKSWMDVSKWTYADRTPSPEKSDTGSAQELSPHSQMEGIAIKLADGLNTPESSKTPIEVYESEELVPESISSHRDGGSTNVEPPKGTWSELFSQPKPSSHIQELAADHVEVISPIPAPLNETELSREEAVDQQFLTETYKPDFVEEDTEENTEVDTFPSELEDRLEGQLSSKQLKAIEQDESSTEEDEPPLLFPGAVPQIQLDDYSSDEGEDSDDALLQVRELERSLTPTEVDSEEEEEPESELEQDVDTQAGHAPMEIVSLEQTTQAAPRDHPVESSQRDDHSSFFEAASQAGATQAMPPTLVRPLGFDKLPTSTATPTPSRTPRSSAINSERPRPTPQLPPVHSQNLPLPSPFPGTSAQEPTSYTDALPLSETQGPLKSEKPIEQQPQRRPAVQGEQDPKVSHPQDSAILGLSSVDPNIIQSHDFADGGLVSDEFSETTMPFPFGLDGYVLSRISKPQAFDTRDEDAPTALVSDTKRQRYAVQEAVPASITLAPELPGEASPTPRESWADVVMQDEPDGEHQQTIDPVEEIDMSRNTAPKGFQSLKEQPVEFNYDIPPLSQESAPTIQDKALQIKERSAFQNDDYQPPSLSFDDDYVPMVDDWDMPNFDSDPVEADPAEEPAQPDGQDSTTTISFGPPSEDYREMSPIPHEAVTPPRPDDNHVFEEPPVDLQKKLEPEVTIIDLDSDTEEDESDAETVKTVKKATPVPRFDVKIGLQRGLETAARLGKPEPTTQEQSPQMLSSQLLSPTKRPQQRGGTLFYDVDNMSQVGSTPQRARPVPAPASQASLVVDRVSNHRREKEIKDSEFEWDSAATAPAQRPSSPPSEADPMTLEDNERYSTPSTTQVLEELSQRPLKVAQQSSLLAIKEARRQNWEHERYSKPFTSQILEDLPQKPIEQLSQRPSHVQNELFSQNSPATTIESFDLSEVEQSVRAQSEASENAPQQGKIRGSSPSAEQSSRAQSKLSQHARTSSPIEGAARVHSTQWPGQETLLTPGPSQQTVYVPSPFPAPQIEQTIPPTPQLTQIRPTAEKSDLMQVKAKTQDLKVTEPASPPREQIDTATGDTTLVKIPHCAHFPSPSFSAQSVQDAKSLSPTLSERVCLYESSKADFSQRLAFTQSQGTRTALGYFTPLSSVSHYLNSQAHIDVLAVCTRATKRPERAKSGARDYFTSFRIADESLDVGAGAHDGSQPITVQVQVFRPWKAALPECDIGDAVLLRNFKPTSRKGKVGLQSGIESAWCVFRYGKGSSQTQKNGDVNEVVRLQYDEEKKDDDNGKKGDDKRRSNIQDSMRPIWADTRSGLWGDLTGLVEGMDDADNAANKDKHNKTTVELGAASKANGTTLEKSKDQVSANLNHGRYNPESGAAREECHGPPVEYGDEERREARRLRGWFVGGSGGTPTM